MTALAEATPLQPRSLRDRVRQRFAEPFEAFGSIWKNRSLRRLEYAWAGSIIGTWAFGVSLGVYAYEQGGAPAVGLAGLLRMLPIAVFGAFAASAGDRYRRVRVMVASDLVRFVLFVVAGLIIVAAGPPLAVYIIGGLIMLSAAPFRPAQAALLPSLTDTPEQLTAMNVVSSTLESVGFFAGPALGGILYAATNAQTVFFASAVTCVWSAFMLRTLRNVETNAPNSDPDAPPRGGFFSESLMGYKTIWRDKQLRLLVSLFLAQTVVAGAVNVFIVVLALKIYDTGPAGVGTLNAATGVGGVIGAGLAAMLIGGKLSRGFAFGMIFWGVPLILIGGVQWEVVGLFALAVVGVANTIIDVSPFTLLQRAAPEEVLTRVFGVLESVLLGGIGLGALLTPLIIHAVGTRAALLIVGCFLPLLVLTFWSRLKAIDAEPVAPRAHVELLQRLSLFQPFSPQIIERLAAKLESRAVEPGEEIIHEGETGDRFYVISDGQFAVDVHGEHRSDLGPGEFFGEVALMRDVPRTATVKAENGGGTLLCLAREDFVPAMRIELLTSLPLFRPLPLPTLEFLASKLVCHQVAAGDVVIREGDDGDRFYIVAEGDFAVEAGGVELGRHGSGGFFGEIALLKNVKRTATVVAQTDGVVFSLTRDDFVPAVTGSAPSNAAADEVVGARLAQLSRPSATRI